MYKQMKPTFDAALQAFPEFAEGNKSLLKKHLTKEVFDQLKDKKTARGVQLKDIINCGLVNNDVPPNVGIYVGDEESFKVFAPLITPIIEDYHKGFKVADGKMTNDLDPAHLKISGDADPDKKFIVQTWISVARNLKGYGLSPTLTKQERLDVEKKVTAILPSLTGDFAGQYYSLNNPKMDEATKQKIAQDLQLFKPGNPLLDAAGINRDFPEGRGTFVSDSKTMRVWVNEEDHVRVISMLPNSDIRTVQERLFRMYNAVSAKLDYQRDEKLSYLTACPTLVGTGLRLLVLAKIPNAMKHPDYGTIGPKYRVDCRCFNADANLYAIAAKGLLGQTEIHRIEQFYEAVTQLIKMEQEIAKK